MSSQEISPLDCMICLSFLTRLWILSMNHLSILVILYISSYEMPLLMASAITYILLSSTLWRSSITSSSVISLYLLDQRLSTCCSSERRAFIRAPSKFVQILITSPVAFICVVRSWSAFMNLSNGSLGILTTT